MSDEDRASLRENLFITLDYLWELSSPYYDPNDYSNSKLAALKHQMDEDVFEQLCIGTERKKYKHQRCQGKKYF